ncbi:hypothetical protein BDL97_16G056300 [Sphagnum fallax]|nr:hypothetical protein BDL97_16G056300 [Sphagnum fallax]
MNLQYSLQLVNRQWKIWLQAHVCTVVAGAHVLLLTTVVVGAFLWGYNIISRKYRIKHDQTQCSAEQSAAGHENRMTNCKSMEVIKAAAAALNQQTDHHPVVLIEPTAMGSPCLFDSAGDVSTYVQVKNTEAAHKFRMGSTLKTAQVTQSSSTNVLKSLQESDQMLPCAIFTQSSMTSGTDHEQDIELDLDYLEYEQHVRAQMEFSAKGYKSVNCKLQQPAWRRSLCMFWQRSKLRSNGMRVFGIDQSCITTTPPPPDHVVDSLRIVVDKLQRPTGMLSMDLHMCHCVECNNNNRWPQVLYTLYRPDQTLDEANKKIFQRS